MEGYVKMPKGYRKDGASLGFKKGNTIIDLKEDVFSIIKV
jgi:hypothetical protein